jgi:tRNA modification GTPase
LHVQHREGFLSKRSAALSSGYYNEDTIVASATPVGGAIAIVRMSGPRAHEFLEKVFKGRGSPRLWPARSAEVGEFVGINGESIDQAVFLRFDSPRSYTGEDSAELHLHGSGFIVMRVQETLIELGARAALAGEFSFRAVRNGKMSLFQAQAVSDLIQSSNDGAVKLALEKLSGQQSRVLLEILEELKAVAAATEAELDFSDQGLDEVNLERLKERSTRVSEKLDFIQKSFSRGNWIQDGVPVSIMGLPNAGKSSFFNCLLGEDRSIVSDVAGTTRDIVREKLTLNARTNRGSTSVTFRIQDTAGIRKTHEEVELIGVERAKRAAQEAALVLWVIDATTLLKSDKIETAETILEQSGISKDKVMGVLTKQDLVAGRENDILAKLRGSAKSSGIEWTFCSPLSGYGVHEISEKMVTKMSRRVERVEGELCLTRQDHLRAVEKAIQDLERAKNTQDVALFADDIRHTLVSLGPLVGDTLADEILEKIFSEFCIGK